MTADLIVIAEPWSGLPGAVHHLMPHLALDHQILWVDADGLAGAQPPAAAPPLASAAPFPVLRAGAWERGRDQGHDQDHSGAAADRARRIRRRACQEGLGPALLWISTPAGCDLIGQLGERAVIYHCLEAGPGQVAAADQVSARLAARADLILAATPALAARYPAGKTRVLGSAVDLELFATPAQPAPELAAALASGRPVAGFHGRIDATFDASLLGAVAARLPDWLFLVIGPVQAPLPRLVEQPNLHLLGPRAHAALPRYSQHWQASLLLRRAAPGSGGDASLPLQLREYLAAGTPIVGRPDGVPATLLDLVTPADDVDALAAALDDALAEPPRFRAERRLAVRGESWAARAATASQWLNGLADDSPARRPWPAQAALGQCHGMR